MTKSIYQPPCTITPEILNQVAAISEAIGRLTVLTDQARTLRLRRFNRVRTIHGSLAIDGNSLSEAQITAILEGNHRNGGMKPGSCRYGGAGFYPHWLGWNRTVSVRTGVRGYRWPGGTMR